MCCVGTAPWWSPQPMSVTSRSGAELSGGLAAAGLRIRTGVTASRLVWVDHLDHVVTKAEMLAVARAVDNALAGEPKRPFHELVREEQRKRFTVVDGPTGLISGSTRDTPPGSASD